MNNEASRKAFEAWCAASNQKYHPTDDGLSNRQDWQTWQASRKALEAEQTMSIEPVGYFCSNPAGDFRYQVSLKDGYPESVPLYSHPAPSPVPTTRPLSPSEKSEFMAVGVTGKYVHVLAFNDQPATPPAMHLSEILAEKGIKLRTEFEPKPDHIVDSNKMIGERAELIARLREAQVMLDYNPVEAHDAMGAAADMLEADAQDAFTTGLACQPESTTGHELMIAYLDGRHSGKAQQAAVPDGSTHSSLRPPRTAQEFHFGMLVLNWNRRQTDPPIDVGRELWVADEMLKLQAFNECPTQKVAASMTMEEIVAAAGAQHIDVYAASFMCGIRAAEARHGITPQGDKS